MTPEKTLIIGGGLSGLAVAETLAMRQQDYLLIEARPRLGGRIETGHHGGGAFDLGPAWFWPEHPRMMALIERLDLPFFEQYAQGTQSFEDERGQVQRGRGISSMEGSLRVDGGFGALVAALEQRLDADKIHRGAEVVQISRGADQITATLSDGQTLNGTRVLLAMPPRIAASIAFDPPLSDQALAAMNGVPTWMAGQAKAVAIYEHPFWREAGLSGDAMSRFGPMVEIHDASAVGGPYALFGFIGVPPAHRLDKAGLHQAVLDQLERLFGQQATTPQKLIIRDWAQERFTAVEADQAPLMHHPTYSLPTPMRGLWDGALQFAGTEVAPEFGGYLEGALEAAEAALSEA